MRRLAAGGLVVAALLTAACASRRVDEPMLWADAHAEETTLLSRAAVYDDPALLAYLDELGQRLVGAALPFQVLRDPTLNLFALPDGHVFVHTGVLAVTENEAQLAALLAHEIAHVFHRDAFELGAPPRIASLEGPVGASRTADAIRVQGLRLTAEAAITGYGRARERAADGAGVASLVRAGWDPKQAPVIYLRLAAQSLEGGPREVFFLGNRSRLGERIETTRDLVATAFAPAAAATTTVTDSAAFDRLVRPVLRENAYEEVRRGRFAAARQQLDRVLAASPADGLAWVYLGDLHRLQAQRARSADERVAARREARAAYERALEGDAPPAEAHRQLGLLYYETNDLEQARAELRAYLALAPGAPDAQRIGEYVTGLDR